MIDYLIRKLRPETDTKKPFDCGNSDLNGFLLETCANDSNATISEKQLLAATYIVEDTNTHDILGYFSLLHDKIDRHIADKSMWNRLSREIPNAKRRSSYPALKIGKLAVSKRIKSQGLGTQIINYIKWWYLKDKRAGCRFITVEALLESELFYKKNYFKRLVNPTQDDETVLMYFDLMEIV